MIDKRLAMAATALMESAEFAAAERLRKETERLAAENELLRRNRERAAMAGLSSLTNRRLGL